MHTVNIVTALSAEARPLIDYFRLKQVHDISSYKVYRNQDIVLAVSGIGKVNSAAATGFLQGKFDFAHRTGWLNVGIAGHQTRDIGAGFLAHTIYDDATGRVWYPSFVFKRPCGTDVVRTVDRVEFIYDEDIAYEMEAAGFYSSACQKGTSEIVHCYKIISDNQEHSVLELDADQISNLVEGHTEIVNSLVEILSELVQKVRVRKLVDGQEEEFHRKWRFSVTQRAKLKKLLTKCQTLELPVSADSESLRSCRDASSVLEKIDKRHRSIWFEGQGSI